MKIYTKDEQHFMKTCYMNSSDIFEITLNELPKYVNTSGYITAIISDNSMKVVNKWGIIINETKLELAPKEIVIFNKSKSIALIYSNEIKIVNL